jgi:hypothetical protein
MHLRRFADGRGRLVMVNRADVDDRRIVTVNNACNEVGFYSIATENLEPQASDGTTLR